MLVCRRDRARASVFEELVTEEVAPGYSLVVREPIALCTIRSRLQRRQYRALPEFKRDLLLMAHNALIYNHASDLPYKLASRLGTLVLNLITRVCLSPSLTLTPVLLTSLAAL